MHIVPTNNNLSPILLWGHFVWMWLLKIAQKHQNQSKIKKEKKRFKCIQCLLQNSIFPLQISTFRVALCLKESSKTVGIQIKQEMKEKNYQFYCRWMDGQQTLHHGISSSDQSFGWANQHMYPSVIKSYVCVAFKMYVLTWPHCMFFHYRLCTFPVQYIVPYNGISITQGMVVIYENVTMGDLWKFNITSHYFQLIVTQNQEASTGQHAQ